jgi:hypothetical protein
MPDRPELNSLLNECTDGVRYLMARGISDWDAAETYVGGAIVRDSVDGFLYVLEFASPTGTRPGLDTAHWSRYFARIRARPDQHQEPIVTWINARGLQRWGLGHRGYPAGQVYQWNENWDLPFAAQFGSTARWLANTNSGAIAILDPGNIGLQAPLFRTVRCNPPTGSAGPTFIGKNVAAELFTNDDMDVEIETPVAMGTVGANRTLVQFGIGVGFNTSPGVFFSKGQGDTNWQIVSASIPTTIDTGVPPVANTYQRLKIELTGVNCVDSGNARVNFYIDGALVGHIDNPIPNGQSLIPFFGASTQTTGGASVFTCCGPMRYRSNLFPGNVF